MRYLQQIKETKKIKLDLKDKKILYYLSENSRTPSTTIAKKVGLSRDAVSYRIKQLEKRGVIQGYRTVVNINKFGYDAYHLFLQLNQPTKEAENILIKKFKKYPFMRAVIKFSGKYDFELALVAKNLKEFDKFLSNILNDCSKYLQDYEMIVITKPYKSGIFPKNFIDLKENEKTIKKSGLEVKMDDKNMEILKILANNASLPLYKIAEKVKLSADAVNYRIKNMIRDSVILKFVPVINYAVLSYNIYAILLSIQNLTNEKEATLKQFLNTDKNILWAIKSIGKYNVIIYVCTKSPDDLHNTLINLRNYFPEDIKKYETLIAYEEYKYTYFPDYVYI